MTLTLEAVKGTEAEAEIEAAVIETGLRCMPIHFRYYYLRGCYCELRPRPQRVCWT